MHIQLHDRQYAKELYSEEDREDADFYIADCKGVPVWNADKIEIDMESTGIEVEEREWTLSHYMTLSITKYPSKARFYCVRKAMLIIILSLVIPYFTLQRWVLMMKCNQHRTQSLKRLRIHWQQFTQPMSQL